MSRNAMALDFLDSIKGELNQIEQSGFAMDMRVRNIRSHVQTALSHTECSPEINKAADDVVASAMRVDERFDGALFTVDDSEKAAHFARIDAVRSAYLKLRSLMATAEPSAMSKALGA